MTAVNVVKLATISTGTKRETAAITRTATTFDVTSVTFVEWSLDEVKSWQLHVP